jgi:hypothetical protein
LNALRRAVLLRVLYYLSEERSKQSKHVPWGGPHLLTPN